VKTLLIASVLTLFLFAPAYAADIDGKWTGTVQGPTGDTPVSFTFKSDGAKLTGSTPAPLGSGPDVAITDGKIDGKNITFKLSLDFGAGMPFDFDYKGVVSATDLKLTTEFFGMPLEINLKKAPASSAAAADLTGKWTAKAPGAQGAEITFVFKMADGKLTGTVNNSSSPGESEITDGKVTGDEISFSLKRTINGAEATVSWKGKISGDEIKFTRTSQGAAGGAPTEMAAKKAK
jgi:opacity protein-like surface antigen